MTTPDHGLQVTTGDLAPDAFRVAGHRTVEWIAGYLAGGVERYPVLARVRPGDVRSALPADAPEEPEPLDRILDDFERHIVPGTTHWNHPGFLAYFGISGSAPGVLGEFLGSALNVNAMLWRTGPAATELEEVALGWVRRMLGLPAEFHGVIQDTASASSLVALAAARHQVPGLDVRERGLAGAPRLVMYASAEAHSSIDKAAIALGIGRSGLRKIPTDAELRMDPGALAAAIREDRAAGMVPFAVVATVGTTSTTSVDPVPEIAAICAEHRLWLHVDAAYGGAAAVLPEMRWVLAGCERADSLVVNPHKWLFTPIDCSALYCRRPDVLRDAFDVLPEYLRTTGAAAAGEPRNLMDYGLSLGRRFRALKLWMVLRAFGARGIRDRIRAHIELARRLAERVDAAPEFERMAPAPLSVVCLRARPRDLAARGGEPAAGAYLDRLNEALLQAVNATGEAFLSHTRVRARFTLRVAIGNLRTTAAHIDRAWEILQAEAARLDRELRPPALA